MSSKSGVWQYLFWLLKVKNGLWVVVDVLVDFDRLFGGLGEVCWAGFNVKTFYLVKSIFRMAFECFGVVTTLGGIQASFEAIK